MCKALRLSRENETINKEAIIVLQSKVLDLIGDPILEQIDPEFDEKLFQILQKLVQEKKNNNNIEEDNNFVYPRRVSI